LRAGAAAELRAVEPAARCRYRQRRGAEWRVLSLPRLRGGATDGYYVEAQDDFDELTG
jgi:hypothetical protein